MTSSIVANLEKMLGSPRDGSLLRYSLGNEWLKAGNPLKAADYFRESLAYDAQYSAAWKLLGKALAEHGEHHAALEAYIKGIDVAEARGDKQAAKEMRIFSKRLGKALAARAETSA